ncbi:RCC1 domain-containing protein 1-like isoform X2 [Sardina pilchardus]|uniref:RCC1 domain-containing protein 1-like isoform X2 n=1 Tax=Sardina pilchardus TaxID=27697 RepID=UPI002E109D9C
MYYNQMTWFGFGFNGFGQIVPFGKVDCETPSENHVKIAVPAVVKCSNDSSVRIVSETKHEKEAKAWNMQVIACWSRTASFFGKGEGQVHLTGFTDGSLDRRKSISRSTGCVDAWITERYLTLRFTDRVECWTCDGANMELVLKLEQDSSDRKTGHSAPLPLVPEGYIASEPPLFRPLSPQLRADRLALGTAHALLLCAGGTIYTWGSGSHGQLGHGTLVAEEEPRVVEALWGLPVCAVAAGGWHSACVSEGGDLYMWGWNESGQLGLPSRRCREESEQKKETGQPKREQEETGDDVFISIQAFPALLDIPHVSEVSSVSCGSRHTAAVSCQGDLYTWGWGDYGQLGHGNLCSSDQPSLVDFFPKHGLCVKDVKCGPWNTFVSATQANPAGPHADDDAATSYSGQGK